AFRKAREETRRGHAPGRSPADVRHIRERALDLLLIIVPEWHAPPAVAGFLSGCEQLLGELLVVRVQTGGYGPERDHASTSKGSDVDDGRRFEALDVGQRIAQDQASLGIGIEDLD